MSATCNFVAAGGRCAEPATPDRYFGRYCEPHAPTLMEAWISVTISSEMEATGRDIA